MAFPKIGGVDPRVPGQNQMNWSAEIDDWSGKAEERLAEKELHRFSASPLLRFSASPLLRFSASPLLRFSLSFPRPKFCRSGSGYVCDI